MYGTNNCKRNSFYLIALLYLVHVIRAWGDMEVAPSAPITYIDHKVVGKHDYH